MFRKYYAPEEEGPVVELGKEVLEKVSGGGFRGVVARTAVCPNCGRELPASQIMEDGCLFCRAIAAGGKKKKPRKIDS